jgi:hypothetical protein
MLGTILGYEPGGVTSPTPAPAHYLAADGQPTTTPPTTPATSGTNPTALTAGGIALFALAGLITLRIVFRGALD